MSKYLAVGLGVLVNTSSVATHVALKRVWALSVFATHLLPSPSIRVAMKDVGLGPTEYLLS